MTKSIEKIMEGFIKFYIVYVVFGAMALIILYLSADLRCFVETEKSLFLTLAFKPGSLSDETVIEIILNFLRVAYHSVPGTAFFNNIFEISFDSKIGADITSLVIDLLQSSKTRSILVKSFQNYNLFWRDMAVATSASLVLYIVSHLKARIAGKGFSVRLGFAMASIFWIFAGYTFGEAVTYALEKRVVASKSAILYSIIIVTAGLLETVIHAYDEKHSVLRLATSLCLKIFFNLLRNAFVLYICRIIISFFAVLHPTNILLNILGMIIATSVVICTILIEEKVKVSSARE